MNNQFRRIGALAKLTIIDGMKRHALIGLVFFALAGEVGGLFFFDFIPRDIGRAANDFLFSISFITGFVFLLFHAVHAIAWDTNNKTSLTFLARPISRTEYQLGLFAGLAVLLFLLNVILGGISWTVLHFIKTSVDIQYFTYLSLPFFFLAQLFLYLIELTILSVIFLFASLVRGSFPVLLLTIAYYGICTGLPVVRESVQQQSAETGTKTLAIILKSMAIIFPDFSRLDIKSFVIAANHSLSTSTMLAISGLHIGYIFLMLWLASVIFRQKDLI